MFNLQRAAAVLLLAASVVAHAAEEVPYVQTPQPIVDAMLMLGAIGPRDRLIDLGSGDGRIVVTAAQRFGTRGLGVDLDTRLVQLASESARKAGVAHLARFAAEDFYKLDLRRATVVTMYLLPDVNLELRPRLLDQLRPGTRVVSHDYDMGDWRPDATLRLPAPGKKVGREPVSDIYMWTVPARVAGRWSGTLGRDAIEIDIAQRYQDVRLDVRVNGQPVATERARLIGDALSFGVPQGAVAVTVADAVMAGEVARGERRAAVRLTK